GMVQAMLLVGRMTGPTGLGGSYGLGYEFFIFNTLFCMSIVAFFLTAAIVSISPISSNRMVPMRILLSVWFVATFLVAVYFQYFSAATATRAYIGANWAFNIWAAVQACFLAFLMLPIICERDSWGIRIRRKIPYVIPFRFVVFPFYTGAACGVAWWLLYGVILLVVAVTLTDFSTLDADYNKGVFAGVFAFNYCITSLLLRVTVLKNLVKPMVTWLIGVILLSGFTIGTVLIYFLINYSSSDPLSGYENSILSVFNPFMLASYDGSGIQMMGAGIWLVALTPLLLAWLFIRLGDFTPEVRDEELTYEKALEIINK
ncbi:MAG: hypothetical protein ACRC2T_02400, partial [Thermoguttaceae bacterium]